MVRIASGAGLLARPAAEPTVPLTRLMHEEGLGAAVETEGR